MLLQLMAEQRRPMGGSGSLPKVERRGKRNDAVSTSVFSISLSTAKGVSTEPEGINEAQGFTVKPRLDCYGHGLTCRDF